MPRELNSAIVTASGNDVYLTSIRSSYDKAGNIYLVGSITRGDRDLDLFVRKYNAAFETVWTYAPKLTGTQQSAAEVALTDSRSVFVTGGTTSRVNGKNFGGEDAFLLHLDNRGKKVWSR